MKRAILLLAIVAVAAILLLTRHASTQTNTKTKNVVLIVLDGVRWQELFTGADATLLNSESGGIWDKEEDLKRDFWRDDVNERRKLLFPFIWTTIEKQGQIFGNQTKGSIAHVTNGLAFSYPGYNEMLTGFPDKKINTNEFGTNPNMTVFEWLNKKSEFKGQVAVYGTWNTFKDIFNQKRSNLAMHVGWDLPYEGKLTPRQEIVNDFYKHIVRFDYEDSFDYMVQVPLIDSLQASHPRVLFVGFGETDNWAHSGRYDLVLHSAHDADHYIEQLWNTMQSIPEYRDQTTFIVTTDHGRGSGPVEWKEHGDQQKGSENVWLAIIGPDTEALGERSNISPVTQSQIAATLAAFLGQNYQRSVSQAAPPISDVLPAKP